MGQVTPWYVGEVGGAGHPLVGEVGGAGHPLVGEVGGAGHPLVGEVGGTGHLSKGEVRCHAFSGLQMINLLNKGTDRGKPLYEFGMCDL